METAEKMKIMDATAKKVKDMLQARLDKRLAAEKTFAPSSLDNLPDDVKSSREQEGSRLRAVIMEQQDLMEILNMMFPNA